MSNKILVIGATGSLGKPVTTELIKNGFDVKVASRNPSISKELFPENENVKVDLRDKESIRNALVNCDKVYLNLSVDPSEKKNDFHSESDGLRNLLYVAKENNVRRVAMISSIVKNYQGMNGFNWWAFDVKNEAIGLLKNSGIPYTIFYPSSFMENFVNGYKRGNKIMLAGKSKYPQYWIAGSDFGRQVASSFRILTDENKEYPVQGKQGLTSDEAAEIFLKHYKKESLKISNAPIFPLKMMGLFSTRYNYFAHIIEALNEYPEKFKSETTWMELGKPEITLKSYAESLS